MLAELEKLSANKSALRPPVTAPVNEGLAVPYVRTLTYQLVVNPLYGSYAGPVSFTLSGLPPGATFTWNPATIKANAGKQTHNAYVDGPQSGSDRTGSGSLASGRRTPHAAAWTPVVPGVRSDSASGRDGGNRQPERLQFAEWLLCPGAKEL